MGEPACTVEEFHRRLREALAAIPHPSEEQVVAAARRLARTMQLSPALEDEYAEQAGMLMAEGQAEPPT